MKKLVVIFTLLFLVSCDFEWLATDREDVIWIINNSSQPIYVYGDYILPDTLLLSQNNEFKYKVTVPSNAGKYISDGQSSFKRLKEDRLTIFVLSKDTVDKYDWETIRAKNMILKRYEFNDEELTEMGGEIVYPPEE